MIHYALKCGEGAHEFDGWFRSGEDFERQAALGLLECPVCGSPDVAKALMRPAVGTVEESLTATKPTGTDSVVAGTVVGGAPADMKALLQKMHEVARQVRASADYVGPSFAEEARRIHYGESEQRQIYGEASGPEVRSLLDEGITALPLPPLPEDKN